MNLKKSKCNLKNSFDSIYNSNLIDDAKTMKINLWNDDKGIANNVARIQEIESDRMNNFASENPNIFLLVSLDITLDDITEEQ